MSLNTIGDTLPHILWQNILDTQDGVFYTADNKKVLIHNSTQFIIKGKSMVKSDGHICFVLICLVIATLVLGSCDPKRIGPMEPSGERLTWPKMSIEQKKMHMAEVVMPRAAEVFRAWRPGDFAQVDCTLCHDSGVITGIYRMPSAHLPRLSGEVLLGPEFEKYPETTRLKLDRLVPVMSESLGLSSFSVITRRGFGCYSCHFGPNGPMFGH